MDTTMLLEREEVKGSPQPAFHSPERPHLQVRLSRKLCLECGHQLGPTTGGAKVALNKALCLSSTPSDRESQYCPRSHGIKTRETLGSRRPDPSFLLICLWKSASIKSAMCPSGEEVCGPPSCS